jgi:formylglycine-generating enzyme required for sulfatase activity
MPGAFVMGSTTAEAGRNLDEGSHHRVELAPFELGRYEVTFDEWDACVTDQGCSHSPDENGWGRGRRPVINVSWEDVQQYLAWLRAKSGQPYRLPSEAEWEYAMRAGSSSPFYTGQCLTTDQANYNASHPYGDCPTGVNRRQTLPVGSLDPNPWGLYDMAGNVWEWTADCWVEDYRGAPVDGAARNDGDCRQRVVRGGSWPYHAGQMRSAFRDKYLAGNRNNSLGLRLAITRGGKKTASQ